MVYNLISNDYQRYLIILLYVILTQMFLLLPTQSSFEQEKVEKQPTPVTTITLFAQFIVGFNVATGNPPIASTLPIPGLYNTGVDNSGVVLPLGTADSHYTLVGSLLPAITITNHPAWVLAPAGSRWIAPTVHTVTDPAGQYAYFLNFSLVGLDHTKAMVSGRWAADNSVQLFLNGVNTGNTTNSFGALAGFTVNSGFNPGANTFEFRTTNSPQSTGNPTGLLVTNFSGTTNELTIGEPIVLEPASILINERITSLNFVRLSKNGFDEIKEISFGEPFYIKAEFDIPPEENEKTVTLDWGEGTDEKREIIVKQQKDNRKIFLSDIIYAKRPTSLKEGE